MYHFLQNMSLQEDCHPDQSSTCNQECPTATNGNVADQQCEDLYEFLSSDDECRDIVVAPGEFIGCSDFINDDSVANCSTKESRIFVPNTVTDCVTLIAKNTAINRMFALEEHNFSEMPSESFCTSDSTNIPPNVTDCTVLIAKDTAIDQMVAPEEHSFSETLSEPFCSSGSEYIPSTDGKSSGSEVFKGASVPLLHQIPTENKPKQNLDSEVLRDIPLREKVHSMSEALQSTKDLCTLCYEEVGHFARHLIRKHSDDENVKKILEMPLKSAKRRNAISALRKKGNFILRQEKNFTKPVKSTTTEKNSGSKDLIGYYPCSYCLGFYKRSYLWRHKKNCKSKTTNTAESTRRNHLTDSQTLLASVGLLGDYHNKSRLQSDVFSIMRPDDISFTAKKDPLIFLYGESYLAKHKRKQMNVVASNKMREMARLKLALEATTSITSLFDALRPNMYDHIVTAAKIVSGYDAETKSFRSSSLALHLGTNLKFLCDIAKKAIITKHPLFRSVGTKEKLKEISQLREVVVNHWCNDISSIAHKSLNEKKWSKSTKLLPLTEDVRLFNNYIMRKADYAFRYLNEGTDVEVNYKLLSECTLSIIIIFNRKRIGEVQFLQIEDYERECSNETQKEMFESLTELEKVVSSAFKRVVVFGKGSKPVPILFTKKMQSFVNIILQIRRTSDIVPKSNKYLFANPRSKDRWMSAASVIRKFAHKCGAKSPELLTSTRFRKQIATILQLMNFEKNEMEQIAKFMGHTEKTHMEFYR